MCTKPLYITKRNFKYLVFSRKVVVPCGSCPECLRKKANDLYVRARMEYDACLRNGGNGFMCCLTYSDDLVPRMVFEEGSKMCFNKQDVINFIKRLRTTLDREYKKRYGCEAPRFKYLITSEYGTDPTRSHRPHYHLLFFFRHSVVPSVFTEVFRRSTYTIENKDGKKIVKRYFGYILQCDLIDPSRGGIQYSAKYVCKDIMFEKQRLYIEEQIRFYKKFVETKNGILPYVDNAEDEFHNSCIRATIQYKQDVEKWVRPWRHRLQFYMCSNDLGGSCVVEKYGQHLEHMALLNFDGFPYALPNIVKSKFERKYGFAALQNVQKFSFLTHLEKALDDAVKRSLLDKERSQDLFLFAKEYAQPYKGHIKFVLPCFDELSENRHISVRKWFDIINEFSYYDDNDFFVMRDALENVLALYNDDENLRFRFRVSLEKQRKDKEMYEQKKRNKNV